MYKWFVLKQDQVKLTMASKAYDGLIQGSRESQTANSFYFTYTTPLIPSGKP